MAAITMLQDFSDRLSPMVVKELRQGLRTRVFAIVMMVLHGLLFITTLVGAAAKNPDAVGGFIGGITNLILCVILPLRGFSALAEEIKSGTLDMLSLTRLSAGRIVLGKWAAIVSQSLLVAFSILPYVVGRYVYGGADLFSEIGYLGLKWLIGAVVTAAIICLSTVRQFWLRALVLGVPLAFVLFAGLGMMVAGSISGRTTSFITTSGVMFGGTLVASASASWAIFYFLTLAATRIAPAASLLSVVKRGVHLVAVLLLMMVAAFSGQWVPLGGAMGTVAAWAGVDALTERVNDVPSVYAAFYRRGFLGRIASWLLAPGWATGALYSLLLCGLAMICVARGSSVTSTQGPPAIWLGCTTVWMTAALVQMTSARRAADLFGPFIGMGFLVLLVSMFIQLMGFRSIADSSAPWLMTILPGTVSRGVVMAQAADKERLLQAGLAISTIWPLLLILFGMVAWRRLRSVREEARRMIQAPIPS